MKSCKELIESTLKEVNYEFTSPFAKKFYDKLVEVAFINCDDEDREVLIENLDEFKETYKKLMKGED